MPNKNRLVNLLKKLLEIEQTYYFDFNNLKEIMHIISQEDCNYLFTHNGSILEVIKDYYELCSEEYNWLFSENWLKDDLCIDVMQRIYILLNQGLPNKYNLYIRNLVPKDWYNKTNINQIKTYINSLGNTENKTIPIKKYLENFLT